MLFKSLPKNLATYALCLIASVTHLFFITLVYAEGSYDLIKSGNGYRPLLISEDQDSSTETIVYNTRIKVFVNAGEQVNLGSSVPNSHTPTQDILWDSPTEIDDGVCDVDSGTGFGFIDTLAKEANGPDPSSTVGYTPCAFTAQETGVYEIEFRAPKNVVFRSPSSDKPNEIEVTDLFPVDDTQEMTVAAWDVTVFKESNNPSTKQTGRVYANYLTLFSDSISANNLTAIHSQVYILNKVGHIYEIDLNGIEPGAFIFFANNKGFTDASIANPLFKSVDQASAQFHNPGNPDDPNKNNITYKIFFNQPDPDLPEIANYLGGTTWLKSTPLAPPIVNSFQFTGSEGTANQAGTTGPQGGEFIINSDRSGNAIVTIEVDGASQDRTLIGSVVANQDSSISWDGLDGEGNPLAVSNYQVKLLVSTDEVHFPFLDVENNPNGLIIKRISNCQQTCDIVYFNDQELDGDKELDGISSSGGAHSFSGNFGNKRGIDTWTFLATEPFILTGGLELKEADLSVSKTHDTEIKSVLGGPITYFITVHNAGPSHVTGIQVQDNLPAIITEPFWTCEVTESLPEPSIQNSCAASGVEGPLNTTVDLQNGATATFQIEATISATVTECATIDNSVTITRPPDVTNPDGDQLDVKTETATHSVTLASLTNNPPVAQDKETTTTNDIPVPIPALSAQDSDGTVASYKIFQLPSKSKGLLYLGDPANEGTLITEGQSLDPAQISTLYFKPNLDFSGEAQFSYKAIDYQCGTSNTATVTIGVVESPSSQNKPPIADHKTVEEVSSNVTKRLPALSGSDEDGEIVSFTVVTLPSSAQGILYLGDPSAGGKPVALEQKLTLNEGAALFFQSKSNISGEVIFEYLTTDDQGANSTPAFVTIGTINLPIIIYNKTISIFNSNITVVLPALSAVDPDGTIESYQIITLPSSDEGVVYLGDPAQEGAPLFIGKMLTPEEVKLLYFKPNSNFAGEAHLIYTATNDDGEVSNIASITISILAPPNVPPIAADDYAVTYQDTPITLSVLDNDIDPEGYLTLVDVMPALYGMTSLDGNMAVYIPNPNTADIVDTFIYKICDHEGFCDIATVTISVLAPTTPQLLPIAHHKKASILNNTTVQLPSLSADGTITKYTIATLPLSAQGTLYLGNPTQGGILVTVGEELNPDQVGELFFQPDGDFIGDASFTYTATDNSGTTSNFALVTIQIEAPVNNHPSANDDFASTLSNEPATISILYNDHDPEGELDSRSISIISPPAHGIATVNVDGTGTYTPNIGFTGFDVFSYEVCDLGTPTQCDTALVTITSWQPPKADNKQTPQTPNNVTITVPTLSATDQDGTIVSFTITTLPPINQGIVYLGKPDENGVTVETGQILIPDQVSLLYFQPNDSFIGDASFTYIATDNQGFASNEALITMPFVAAIVNHPPIANDDTGSTNPDTPVVIAILQNDSDPEGSLDPSSIIILNQPLNGQVVINPDGTVTYTPNPSFTNGIDTFIYEVCDSNEPPKCDTAQVSVTVPIGDPLPEAYPQTAKTTTNDQTVLLPALFATDNGTVVSYTIATLPPPNQGVLYLGDPNSDGTPITLGQILTIGQEGQLFFQPNSDFIGNASFTYTATDNVGGISNIALVTIPVTALPIPNADNDVAITEPSTPVIIDILANDKDSGSPLDPSSILITEQPTHGTITVNQDGTVTYTPHSGVGNVTDTLTYQVCDSRKPPLCDTAKVTITILGGGLPPIAHDDSRATDPDIPIKINILENDNDPEGALDPKSVTIITQAPNGQVVVNSDGSVIYTPNQDFTKGTDVFVYQVCDTGTPLQCAQAAVSVTVPIPDNLPPVADNKTADETAHDASVQLPALSATDSDGSIASYMINTLPPVNQGVLYLGDPLVEGILVTAAQVLTPNQISQLFFQPNLHFVGIASFTYTATDNIGAISNAALVTIPVQALPISPILANDDHATTKPNTPITIAVLNNDSDLPDQFDPSQIDIVSPPSHGQIITNPEGTITYTPHQKLTTGSDTFTYEICDLGTPSQCDTAQVTITIISPPIAHDKETPATPNNKIIAIPALSAESDNTIVSYTITALPSTATGTLYLGSLLNTPILSGQVLTPTQAKKLFFQPASEWVGKVTFNYRAADDQDNLSNTATVTIPVILSPTIVVDDDRHEEALFSGKIWSSGGKVGKQLSIDAPEYIKVTGYIQPSSTHIGQLADIILTYHWTAHSDGSSLTVPVTIASQQRLTAEMMEIALFEGYLIGLTGQFDLSLGYQLNTGELQSAPIATLTVEPNRPPVALTLSYQTISEYSATDTLIGSFSTRDPDQQEQFRYGLVNHPDDYFKVVGNELRVNRSLPSHEVKSSYAITVRSVDLSGGYIERSFLIEVRDTEAQPQEIRLTHHTVLENSYAGTTIGRLWTPDPKPSHYSYELFAPADGPFKLEEDLLVVAPEATLDFETQPTYTITVRSWKSKPQDYLEQTFTIELVNQIEVTVLAETPKNNQIMMKLIPDPVHQGESVQFMSVIVWQPVDSNEFFMYRLNETQWIPWNGNLAELSSGSTLILQNQHDISLVLDPLFDLAQGEVKLFVGYQLPTGEIFYTAVPWQ